MTVRYCLSTSFKWYAGPILEWLIDNFEDVILGFYAHRAESDAARAATSPSLRVEHAQSHSSEAQPMRTGVWRIDDSGANADEGKVVWSPFKSIWHTAMYAIAIVFDPLYFRMGIPDPRFVLAQHPTRVSRPHDGFRTRAEERCRVLRAGSRSPSPFRCPRVGKCGEGGACRGRRICPEPPPSWASPYRH